MTRHVALVGFMAAGKSTIGRKLARTLDRPFFDTDKMIVAEHGAIATIFAQEGEAVFRRYESAAIARALDNDAPSVIALGGGALTVEENRARLSRRSWRVFVKVSPEQAFARIRRSRAVRPVLGDAPTLATIAELYARRLAEYERADFIVDASSRSDAAVIAAIAGWLRESPAATPLAAS
jgi:shikimate kinase